MTEQHINLTQALRRLPRLSFPWTARTFATCISISFTSGTRLLHSSTVCSHIAVSCFACAQPEWQFPWVYCRSFCQSTRRLRWPTYGRTRQSSPPVKRCERCMRRPWRNAEDMASTCFSSGVNGPMARHPFYTLSLE